MAVRRPAPSTKQKTALPAWAPLLRRACGELQWLHERDVVALSVTARLCGTPGEERLLRAASERLAETHGLQASVRVRGRYFTVRLSRAPGRGGEAKAVTDSAAEPQWRIASLDAAAR